jgi:hypothetical protein
MIGFTEGTCPSVAGSGTGTGTVTSDISCGCVIVIIGTVNVDSAGKDESNATIAGECASDASYGCQRDLNLGWDRRAKDWEVESINLWGLD